MSHKYHSTEFRISNGGDIFRINGAIVSLPFSAATQTDNNIIPESYHVSGMILASLATKGRPVSSRLVSEIGDCVAYYIRTFRNNPSAAKHHTDPKSPWILA